MANNWPANRQGCGTCQFWTGERKIIQGGRIVQVPDNEYRPCNAGKGSRMGYMHGVVCKEYKRWVDLP